MMVKLAFRAVKVAHVKKSLGYPNVFAPNALWYGLAEIVLVIFIFWYRHYLVDRGVWPVEARKHLQIQKAN